MDVMTVNIGKIKYSIPMTEILETIPLAETYALTIGENNNAIKLRDDIIPIIKLENLLEEDLNKKVNKKRSLLVVVKKNNKKACLFVDSVERIQQTVIKSVPTYFGNIDFISGCSILANGEISPIMDIGNLINKYLEV